MSRRRRNPAIKSYKLKDGTEKFEFQLYIGINPNTGKEQRTRRRGFSTFEEADATYNQLLTEIDNGTYAQRKKQDLATFEDVYKSWLDTYIPTVKPSTANKTQEWFRDHIITEFGDKLVDKITPADCQKSMNKWSKSLVRYKTFGNYASRVFHYAVVLGLRDDDPMKRIVVPKSGKKSTRNAKENFWDRQELQRFLHQLEHESLEKQTMFHMLAFTGLRRGELLALKWRDINLKDKTLAVTKTLIQPNNDTRMKSKNDEQTPKTRAGNRVVPIDDTTLKLLKSWQVEQRKLLGQGKRIKLNQLIFTTADNKHLPLPQPGKWLDAIITKINATSQIPLKRITTHGFRHTFATLLYESDPRITPKDVQKILGHDTVQVTMDIYTHATQEGQKRVTESLSKFMDL